MIPELEKMIRYDVDEVDGGIKKIAHLKNMLKPFNAQKASFLEGFLKLMFTCPVMD